MNDHDPLKKLEMLNEAFPHVSLGSEKPNWVCFAVINLKRVYVGEGTTPEEAINACWESGKR